MLFEQNKYHDHRFESLFAAGKGKSKTQIRIPRQVNGKV